MGELPDEEPMQLLSASFDVVVCGRKRRLFALEAETPLSLVSACTASRIATP